MSPARSVAAALLVALAALAAPPALGSAPGPAGASVSIQNFAFNPAGVTVDVGEAVTWTNHDAFSHTATSDDGSTFDSGVIASGGSYTHTFNAAGTFAYHCSIHASMHGNVTVIDPTAKPDLLVTKIAGSASTPGVQETLQVTVKNQGLNLAGPSDLLVGYVYHGSFHKIGDVSVPQIGPIASTTVSLTWDVTGKIGDFDVRAIADADNQVAESNENNNVLDATITLLVPVSGLVPGIDLLNPLG